MTYSTNLENIDGEALKKIITKRGLVMADVSDAIGFEKNYISRSISRGTMGKSAMAALKGLYGISPEEYKKKPPVTAPEQLKLPLFQFLCFPDLPGGPFGFGFHFCHDGCLLVY